MNERYIIDRFEGETAVCETQDEETIAINRADLPDNVREGMVIRRENGVYFADEQETKSRQERIRNLLKRVIK
jgi:hypothetical protein